jgi:hypothetical protein
MSSWGWHTAPFSDDVFSPSREEIRLTEYESVRGVQRYAVKKYPGNENVYDWFRENPHRLHLGRIGLKDGGVNIDAGLISRARQELDLFDGILGSSFVYRDVLYTVLTVCDSLSDTVSFSLSASSSDGTRLAIPVPEYITVEIDFPYGSPKKAAARWDCPDAHATRSRFDDSGTLLIGRTLDRDGYSVAVRCTGLSACPCDPEHRVAFHPSRDASTIECSFRFSRGSGPAHEPRAQSAENSTRLDAPSSGALPSFAETRSRAKDFWNAYWQRGGFIDLSRSEDVRAFELERRIILSQYLLVIQSCGSVPPQETGLSCNSWYGKFHLEMYPFHTAWLALWGHTDILEKSLAWFPEHLEHARRNARSNGFRGARWPKMIGPDAIDSPSPIATLLVWQQPHILYMLELAYESGKGRDFLERYRDCVCETAEFMADLAHFDPLTKRWNIESPVIPVQEEHDPSIVRNPAFEVEYWRWGLLAAIRWLSRLGEPAPSEWQSIADNMAAMPSRDGVYIAHDNCPETFTRFAKDHPSMLMSFGFIPNDRVDPATMKQTLDTVVGCWDYESLWGWDFAMMALTAKSLGQDLRAIDFLLADTPKNSYVASGNNRQSQRQDLPLYLPGNGSLLLAVAHMAATGAFPANGWNARFENLRPLFG